jgi:hypothetical protein
MLRNELHFLLVFAVIAQISTSALADEYKATCVSSQVPEGVGRGQDFYITLRWTNTGTHRWDNVGMDAVVPGVDPIFDPLHFSLINPDGTETPFRSTTFASPLSPGASEDLVLRLRAPLSAGAFAFVLRLFHHGTMLDGRCGTAIVVRAPL